MLKTEIPSHLEGEPWRRMPKPKERLSGLSRTTLLELSEAGLIRTVAIRKPGAIKGIRLVYMPSLLAYLNRLAGVKTPGWTEERGATEGEQSVS
jgi:hypothetical protein